MNPSASIAMTLHSRIDTVFDKKTQYGEGGYYEIDTITRHDFYIAELPDGLYIFKRIRVELFTRYYAHPDAWCDHQRYTATSEITESAEICPFPEELIALTAPSEQLTLEQRKILAQFCKNSDTPWTATDLRFPIG